MKRVLTQMQAETWESAEHMRRLEVKRLDHMLVGLWNQATRSHLGSVDGVLRIMKCRAKVLGLDVRANGRWYFSVNTTLQQLL